MVAYDFWSEWRPVTGAWPDTFYTKHRECAIIICEGFACWKTFELKHSHTKSGSFLLQLGIDIGSSTVARGVVSLVLGYLNNLVIEMAFLVQVTRSDLVTPFSSSGALRFTLY